MYNVQVIVVPAQSTSAEQPRGCYVLPEHLISPTDHTVSKITLESEEIVSYDDFDETNSVRIEVSTTALVGNIPDVTDQNWRTLRKFACIIIVVLVLILVIFMGCTVTFLYAFSSSRS